jgi:hypothetical protein
MADAWAAAERFIMSVALPAAKSTPQLGYVSTVLADLHSKQAVPLLMDELTKQWTAHQKGDNIYFANTIKDLEKVLGDLPHERWTCPTAEQHLSSRLPRTIRG